MLLRNDGRTTLLPLLKTGLPDSNFISIDQESKDLRPEERDYFGEWWLT